MVTRKWSSHARQDEETQRGFISILSINQEKDNMNDRTSLQFLIAFGIIIVITAVGAVALRQVDTRQANPQVSGTNTLGREPLDFSKDCGTALSCTNYYYTCYEDGKDSQLKYNVPDGRYGSTEPCPTGVTAGTPIPTPTI